MHSSMNVKRETPVYIVNTWYYNLNIIGVYSITAEHLSDTSK